jgi:hypothetical protein
MWRELARAVPGEELGHAPFVPSVVAQVVTEARARNEDRAGAVQPRGIQGGYWPEAAPKSTQVP